MKIIIKELKEKNEIVINVSEDDTTYDAKKEIEKLSNISVSEQKLIFLGKIMKDDVKIKEYKIVDGSKLMLTRIKPLSLRQLLVNHFQHSFDPTTAGSLADLFILNHKKNIASEYSLDDIERIASFT